MTGNTQRRNRSSASILVCVLAAGFLGAASAFAQPTPGDCLTADEATLAQLVNDYRQANNFSSRSP